MSGDQEFVRGHTDASNGNRPWHVKRLNLDQRFNPDFLSSRYIEGYSHGYGLYRQNHPLETTGQKSFNEYYFNLGYKCGIRRENPVVSHDSYIEGCAMGELDYYDCYEYQIPVNATLRLDDKHFLTKLGITKGSLLWHFVKENSTTVLPVKNTD